MSSLGCQAEASEDPTSVVLYKSVNRAGATFSLSPETQHDLERRFGASLHPAPRVFVAHGTQEDYARRREEPWKVLVLLRLLTGLEEERLSELGKKVEIRDPVTDQPLG